jgi:hypothetical protein
MAGAAEGGADYPTGSGYSGMKQPLLQAGAQWWVCRSANAATWALARPA